MFSAWDFNGWIASVGVVLFLLVFLISLGLLVNALICRIWGKEPDEAAMPHRSSTAKEPSIRKAA